MSIVKKMAMPYEEIPFMHWGVVSKYNFSKEKAKLIPRKRWDPLSAAEIRLVDQSTGKAYPIGKWKGHFSYISPVRSSRPGENQAPVVKDVFKDIVEGKDYAIPVTLDEKPLDSVFSVEPIMCESLRDYTSVTIVNRFPAMVRHIDPEIKETVSRLVEDKYTRIAFGINLVTFPTSYYETLSDVPLEILVSMLSSMKSAIIRAVEESRSKGFRLIPVYPFFNIGRLAGGTQPRLHSQVYIDLNEDGHGAYMESILQAFEEMRINSGCHLCTSRHEDRIVYENETWISWATSSPRRNYHVRAAPKRHVARYTDLSSSELLGLADVLRRVSRAMDRLGITRDRNVLFYSNPYGYDSFFHMFIDIIPFEHVGGIEMLDSVRVARVTPEEAAEQLRSMLEKD